MMTRRRSLILPLLLLPSLLGCGSGKAPAEPPPLGEQALAAVTARPGTGREELARAIDDLFADEDAGTTRALVILYQGRKVAERYTTGFGPRTRLNGGAIGNCVTNVMIGLLVADGRLRLNESAPVPRWQRSGDPRGEITLRQLLQMRSGLSYSETSDRAHASDKSRMLFLDGRDNMAAYAEAQPLEAEPGRKFEFSSATPIILADIAAHTLTDSPAPAIRAKAVADYLRTRFLEPAGMRSLAPEFDVAGTLIGGDMMHATVHDWAKLGEFLRNGGSVRGAQLLPHGWVTFMTSASSRNPGYGAGVWLNRPQPEGIGNRLFPGKAPSSLFACIGEGGQYVLVSPRQKLTVVRLGEAGNDDMGDSLRDHLADIVALFPQS